MADKGIKNSARRNLSARSGKSEITTGSTAKNIHNAEEPLERSKKRKEVNKQKIKT